MYIDYIGTHGPQEIENTLQSLSQLLCYPTNAQPYINEDITYLI